MNDSQRARLTANIEKRIGVLENLLASAGSSRATDEGPLTSDDSMVAAVGAQITESEKRELLRLQSNLKWLASDSAGYCENCGDEIPVPRLEVVPVTRLCVNCAH